MISRRVTRTDLATVRAALDDAAATSTYAAAKRRGLSSTTIHRWQLRAMLEPDGWPTPADIEAWQVDHAAHAPLRAARARQVASYRARRYLARGPLWVPAHGTVRRLRALCALGWTCSDLGERLGVTASRVAQITVGRASNVHRDTYNAVTALYETLHMTVPDHHPDWVMTRQRRIAAGKGWAPPLAYDDGDLDDPRFVPSQSRLRSAA